MEMVNRNRVKIARNGILRVTMIAKITLNIASGAT